MLKFFSRYIIFIGFSLFLLLFLSLSKAEDKPFNLNNPDQEEVLQKNRVQVETLPEEKSDKITVNKLFVNIPHWKKAESSDFQPKKLTVKVGDTVIWINNDTRTHFITSMKDNYPTSNYGEKIEEDEEDEEEEEEKSEKSDDIYFTSDYMDKGVRFSYTFEKQGVYKYFCYTHPIEMQGYIVVEE